MCNSTLYMVIDTMLRDLSRMAGFADGDFVPERRLLRTSVMSAIASADEGLSYMNRQALMADTSLAEISAACRQDFNAVSMTRCVDGYLDFLNHTERMELSMDHVEGLLREMLFVTWQAGRGLDQLRERLVQSVDNAAEYVFEALGEAMEALRGAMSQLMHHVAGLIDRLWSAAKSKAKVSAALREMRLCHFRNSLANAVEVVMTDRRELFESLLDAYDSAAELADEWRERHIESADLDNIIIEFNPRHRKSDDKVAAFITAHRDGGEEFARQIDEYLRYDAFFVFLDRMVERYSVHEDEDKDKDEDKVQPMVVRDEGGNTYYVNQMNVNSISNDGGLQINRSKVGQIVGQQIVGKQ